MADQRAYFLPNFQKKILRNKGVTTAEMKYLK